MSIEATSLAEFNKANAKAAVEFNQHKRAADATREAAEAELLAALEEASQRRAQGIRALFVDIMV